MNNVCKVILLGCAVIGCSERQSPPENVTSSVAPADAGSGAARLLEHRARFTAGRWQPLRPALEPSGRTLRVESRLPGRADTPVEVIDVSSNVRARFQLRGATSSEAITADGLALYRDALPHADVIVRADGDGVEDFVVFEERPAAEELVYDVELGAASRARSVGRSVEILDPTGGVALRVAPPWVLDARGHRHDASIRLEGCGGAAAPGGPERCAFHVAWSDVTYPVLVDPSWISGLGAFREKGHATLTRLPGGRAITIGGFSNEIYDSATNKFTDTFGCQGSHDLYTDRHTSTMLASGSILVVGGNSMSDTDANAAAAYLDVPNGCVATGAMAVARGNHTATALPNGKVLVTGGRSSTAGTSLASAEIYDAATGAFAPTGAMSVARVDHTATLLLTGKVLVNAGTTTTSAELFNPATGTFAPTGPMTTVRLGTPTATLLPNGKVLVIGGRSDAVTPLASAELYDPATGTFSATGSMLLARDFHLATLLPNGKVLVLGGDTNAAELYDPKTGKFTATVPSIASYPAAASVLLENGRVLVIPEYGASEVYDPTKPLGVKCATAADCESGFCTDGVCCDAGCAGQCQACDVAGKVGTCTTVTGAPHAPRKPCAGAGSFCGGSCRGVNPNACSFADSKSICASVCKSNSQTTSTCNGLGDCVAGAAVTCSNLICADEHTCKPSCLTNADCVPGFACQGGKCINGTTCIDDHTAQPLDGAPRDCAPYRCDFGCKDKCISVSDCTTPNVCDLDGKCVPPDTAPSSDDGCNASGGSGGPLWPIAGFVALALARRRTRRRDPGRLSTDLPPEPSAIRRVARSCAPSRSR